MAKWVQVDHSSQKPGHQNPLPESFSDFSAKISELSLGRSKIDNDDSGKRRFHSGKNRKVKNSETTACWHDRKKTKNQTSFCSNFRSFFVRKTRKPIFFGGQKNSLRALLRAKTNLGDQQLN